MVEFRVLRYNPDKPQEAKFASYNVADEKGMTVLEGLFYILENIDNTLAFRSSCRAAVCGSCAVHINGQYRLACRTQIAQFGQCPVVIRPLAHLPIVKDLVTDMKPFFDNYRKIKPYLIVPAEKNVPQSPVQRKKIDGWIDCILCGSCYGSCPVSGTSSDYLGPHALMKALRFIDDSRDEGRKERLAIVGTNYGVFRCHTVFNCQQVCPKDLDPAKAIAKLKMKSVMHAIFGG
jgi:succinate dehydrogenase / fumarate reductase iron-sulfur subunit